MTTTWSAAKQCGKAQPKPCCEQECTSGARNRYFSGKRLSPDALRVEQDYQLERRRMINRAMHGWGVVYGYGVATDSANPAGGTLAIGPGLALDRMGRELVQVEPRSLSLDDMLELPGGSGDCWLLRVHYAEQLAGPVSVKDECSCEREQWDRVCETVRYSLQRVPLASCCDAQACELECGCTKGPCCGETVAPPEKADADHVKGGPEHRAQAVDKGPRGGAACCLCEHVSALQPGAQCSGLSEVAEGLRVDLHNGVPLACIALETDQCEQWRIKEVIDACGPRRLVKRNEMLFDLIRGCDLTRISDISWGHWLAPGSPVPWNDFDSYFDTQRSPQGGCVTRFKVAFSRPVQKASVTPDCFAMTFLIRQREGGWLMPMRAPIVRIDFSGAATGQPDLVSSAALVVSWGWVSDALRGLANEFERPGVGVEIEIRGDHILDCNGQAVDANARGHRAAPTGNGTPGGTYLSHFTLGEKKNPAPDPDQPNPPSTDDGGNKP